MARGILVYWARSFALLTLTLAALSVGVACKLPPQVSGTLAGNSSAGVESWQNVGASAVRRACQSYVDEDVVEMKKTGLAALGRICTRLRAQVPPGSGPACLPKMIMQRWERAYAELFEAPLTEALSRFSAPEPNACARRLISQHLYERLLDYMADHADAGQVLAVWRGLSSLDEAGVKLARAWRFSRLDGEGCVIATPQAGGADLGLLPLMPPRQGVSLTPVRLCNESMMAIHRVKDPDQKNLPLSDPLLYQMTWGGTHMPGPYGAPNCHGTAQALAGGFLMSLPVSEISFETPLARERCETLARERLAKLVENRPPAQTFAAQTKGLLVKSLPWGSCASSDCGLMRWQVKGCENGEIDSIFELEGLCEHCYERLAARAGLVPLPKDVGAEGLTAGCLLHANDHTTTVIARMGALCYAYETTTPYGPAVLNVDSCAALWAFFPRRLCPAPGSKAFDWRM